MILPKGGPRPHDEAVWIQTMNDSYSGNRLTLLHVVHDFLPYHSHGTEQATYHLARAQLEAGHRVAVVARACQFLGILRYACVGSEGLREMDLAQGKVVY